MNANHAMEYYKLFLTSFLAESDVTSEAIHPLVTRCYQSRDVLQNDELQNGHFTLMFKGEKGDDQYKMFVFFLVIGRVYCGLGAKGDQVESQEIVLLDKFKRFVEERAAEITTNAVSCSQQQEVPHGWFIAECAAGPFDFSDTQEWLGTDVIFEGVKVSRAPDIGVANFDKYVDVDEL